MIEEDNIRDKFGKNTPFKVPDGYFEQLTDSIMSRLPQKATRPKARLRKLRYISSIAAAVCAISLCATYATGLFTKHKTETMHEMSYTLATDDDEDEFLDELLDYSMTDNMEIAYYLTTAE